VHTHANALLLSHFHFCSLSCFLFFFFFLFLSRAGARARAQPQNRAKLRKYIEEYHLANGIDFEETDIDTFIYRRPDGLPLDKGKKLCVFLEYTGAEDWAEKKEQEKKDRYSSHLNFINHLSNREKSGRKAS